MHLQVLDHHGCEGIIITLKAAVCEAATARTLVDTGQPAF